MSFSDGHVPYSKILSRMGMSEDDGGVRHWLALSVITTVLLIGVFISTFDHDPAEEDLTFCPYPYQGFVCNVVLTVAFLICFVQCGMI